MGTTVAGAKLEADEGKYARCILEETTRHIKVGFETGLLWKKDCSNFPNSYSMAVRRLQSLEKKLKKEPLLMGRVQEQIAEYERKAYVHKITKQEMTKTDVIEYGIYHWELSSIPRSQRKLDLFGMPPRKLMVSRLIHNF